VHLLVHENLEQITEECVLASHPTSTKHINVIKIGTFGFCVMNLHSKRTKHARKNQGSSSRINMKQFEGGTGYQYNQSTMYQKHINLIGIHKLYTKCAFTKYRIPFSI
jgi:hypothetical protein